MLENRNIFIIWGICESLMRVCFSKVQKVVRCTGRCRQLLPQEYLLSLYRKRTKELSKGFLRSLMRMMAIKKFHVKPEVRHALPTTSSRSNFVLFNSR